MRSICASPASRGVSRGVMRSALRANDGITAATASAATIPGTLIAISEPVPPRASKAPATSGPMP